MEPQKEREVHLVAPCVLVYRSTRACFTDGHTLPYAKPPLLSLGQESQASTATLLHCLHLLAAVRKVPMEQFLVTTGALAGGPGRHPWWVRALTTPTWNSAVQR